MGKKAQQKRSLKKSLEKERKETMRRLERRKNPWSRFWARLDFWVYTLCLVALFAFPFVRPEAFSNNSTAVLRTTLGDIEVELYGDDAPKTVDNFRKLATRNYYDNTTFHRVIKGFMIQAGDPSGDGTGGESANGDALEDEINADSLGLNTQIVSKTPAVANQLSDEDKPIYSTKTVKEYFEYKGYKYLTNVKSHHIEVGSLVMANYGPNTNGSQFFIVTEQDQPHLDGQHTVFGKVTKGLDIVKKISEVEVDENDKPLDPAYLSSIIIE